jgi:hypothetical protein
MDVYCRPTWFTGYGPRGAASTHELTSGRIEIVPNSTIAY